MKVKNKLKSLFFSRKVCYFQNTWLILQRVYKVITFNNKNDSKNEDNSNNARLQQQDNQ